MKIRGDLGRGLRRDWLLKPRCNMIKFSFAKHESDCSECRSLLEAISVDQVENDGYSSGAEEKGIGLKFGR